MVVASESTSQYPRKRARIESELANDNPLTASINRQIGLFAPFRALGLVTNGVPFALQTRSFKGASDGPRVHILTCLGRSWALWEGGKMGLLFAGPDTDASITCVAFDGDAIWASAGSAIIRYIRGKEVSRIFDPLEGTISSVLIFGTQLLALTEDGRRLVVWNTETLDVQTTISFPADFTATMMLHPATYLNKILVASSQGTMQLWNIRSETCIHSFSVSSLLTSPNRASSVPATLTPITALTQSPAIDVVGIGFQSGEISVYDVRADERLMRMYMEGGSIRALDFRTDEHAILASGSSAGHVALWDLNAGGRLVHIIRGAHDGAVCSLAWIPNQPVLVSSGDDNSVKQWLFDSPTAPPRLLKFRSGHHQPPHLIRYYGNDGKQLLTASRDRSLRYTSVVRDSRSFEMSQGSLAKKAASLSTTLTSLKFPPVTSIAYSNTRSKDWDDVVTAHAEETFARTWTVQNKRIGKHTLTPSSSSRGQVGGVKAVCVSVCGNFGLAGTSTGIVDMWNLQSGAKRKSFAVGPSPAAITRRSRGKKTEQRVISGIATDSLNRTVIASTLDGTINFFDFHSAKLEHTLQLPSKAVSILLHRDSGLLAVVCDDMVVRIVDIETYKVVRELTGFQGRIQDITFSPDSRWLIVASLDSVIRTFDIPTGRLIDAFRTSSVATSVSFSPTNDFLATAHVDSVGVYLWANRAQYAEVSYKTAGEGDIVDVSLPSTQGVAEEEALEALKALTVDADAVDVFTTPDQLDEELVTLTLLPRSRWQTLLNLEVIQQRNKPKEAPKAPEKAPFFLPTLPGVEHRFVIDDLSRKTDSQKRTRRLEKMAAETESVFLQKLEADDSSDSYESFFTYVKTLSPAALDLELRSLITLDQLRLFLGALVGRLSSRRDFEAVQTLQNVFLRMHGETIIANEELRSSLETLNQIQRNESEKVLELLASSLGTLGFVRDVM